MNKLERLNAVRNMKAPDYMPVWPRAMSQIIYGMGWTLAEVMGNDWYDSGKFAAAILQSLKKIDYDVVLPAYIYSTFGITAAGGRYVFTDRFGYFAGFLPDKPVKNISDWSRVQKRLAHANVRNSDPLMRGALETIRNVSSVVGKTTPLVGTGYLASTAAMMLFRSSDDFINDMINRPEFANEMCRVAADWTMDWIRAQYEAGVNSVTFLIDTMGINMMSPLMGERFNFHYLCETVDRIGKEFNQGVWLHIHGNMKTPMGNRYLEKIVEQSGIEGLHLDKSHSPRWIKKNVIDRFGIPACIVLDCHKIAAGPASKIEALVKESLTYIDDGLGTMMAPCCHVLPYTSNENFKAWVDATHEQGVHPLQCDRKL
jgi:uroporphyrinogen-III decarboxylase